MSKAKNDNYLEFIDRLKKTEDASRKSAVDKRHNKKFNTARETLNNVIAIDKKKQTISHNGSIPSKPYDVI